MGKRPSEQRLRLSPKARQRFLLLFRNARPATEGLTSLRPAPRPVHEAEALDAPRSHPDVEAGNPSIADFEPLALRRMLEVVDHLDGEVGARFERHGVFAS